MPARAMPAISSALPSVLSNRNSATNFLYPASPLAADNHMTAPSGSSCCKPALRLCSHNSIQAHFACCVTGGQDVSVEDQHRDARLPAGKSEKVRTEFALTSPAGRAGPAAANQGPKVSIQRWKPESVDASCLPHVAFIIRHKQGGRTSRGWRYAVSRPRRAACCADRCVPGVARGEASPVETRMSRLPTAVAVRSGATMRTPAPASSRPATQQSGNLPIANSPHATVVHVRKLPGRQLTLHIYHIGSSGYKCDLWCSVSTLLQLQPHQQRRLLLTLWRHNMCC